MVPGIRALLAQLHAELDELETGVSPATWHGKSCLHLMAVCLARLSLASQGTNGPSGEKHVMMCDLQVEPTWAGLVEPLERIVDRLSRAWGTVGHLKVCVWVRDV